MLDHIIFQIGSGNAFFIGVAMILVGIVITRWAQGRWLSLARNLVVVVGGIVVTISATPLSWALYAILAVLTIGWLAVVIVRPRLSDSKYVFVCILLASVWLIVVALELPFHFGPTLAPMGRTTLFLIGDSVSAGMTEAEKDTWPALVAANQQIEVRDFSKMGATVGSALKQAAQIGDRGGLILLEIGGNDVLGSTTAEEYEIRLDQLLTDICRPNRVVVMLELPLPPFANRFGMIQRRLAAKHSVLLVPKRVFIGVLTTPGATVDGIHLSKAGHALMAESIWAIVRPAYEDVK